MKIYNCAVLIVCIVVLAASIVCQADELGISVFGLKWHLYCVSKHLLGIRCALCGMTHSFCAIGHGQLAKAFEYHRLGPILFCFILFQIPYRISLVTLKVRKKSLIKKANVYFAASVGIAIIVNWLFYLGGKVI